MGSAPCRLSTGALIRNYTYIFSTVPEQETKAVPRVSKGRRALTHSHTRLSGVPPKQHDSSNLLNPTPHRTISTRARAPGARDRTSSHTPCSLRRHLRRRPIDNDAETKRVSHQSMKDQLSNSIGPEAETSQAGVEGRSGVSTPPWARQSTPPTWNVSVKPAGRKRKERKVVRPPPTTRLAPGVG